ncbi:hypothetical protein C1I98_22055 [Spongiactinospora gelatinilytica]|uniref:Copper(I)-binding protein n=1 Tax=Spongiactinospora gelatinilytica TaxID=2666298 RepID=A0A2W2HQG5_9ACTN|nr:copper chaperone PCu(A)C [Spongiactinospora gelatinilytica]PZG41024.1 hypothetical protein C1I98_22055 [Spongiactinospora gelatinilytica]
MTRTSRRWAIAAAAFLAAPVLAGCAAGFDATTVKHYSPTEARATTVRGIQISQGFVLGPEPGGKLPKGGSAPVYLSLTNIEQQDDQLVGVAVNNAGTVKLAAPIVLPRDKRVSTSGAAAPGATPTAGTAGPPLVIEGLTKELAGGEYIAMSLQFANAGAVDLTLPVVARSREFATWAPAPAPTTQQTPTTGPTPAATATPVPTATATLTATEDASTGGH